MVGAIFALRVLPIGGGRLTTNRNHSKTKQGFNHCKSLSLSRDDSHFWVLVKTPPKAVSYQISIRSNECGRIKFARV